MPGPSQSRPFFPDGQKLRAIRSQKGLTQTDLGGRAQVSERTVRYAENGKPIRHDYAGFMARALGVTPAEFELTACPAGVIQETGEADPVWRDFAQHLMACVNSFVFGGDTRPVLNLIHPEGKWRCRTSPANEFNGTYVGRAGMEEYFAHVGRFLTNLVSREPHIERCYGSGKLIVFSGTDRLVFANGADLTFWFTHIYTLHDQMIYDVEQLGGLESDNTPAPDSNAPSE